MDQVSVVRSPASPLRLTEHPLQRCGAWAVATLAGRERVEDVTDEQLEGVIKRIVDDAVESATASPGIGAYDWWKILFALYPNSKLTHNKRSKDRAVLSREANQLFLPDDAEGPGRACTFCGQRCTTLWSKMTLPLFDSNRSLNTLPPGTAGWPVCRGCRVALWALPYGAWVTAGSATVLMCDNPQVERHFTSQNVRCAARIRQTGFKGLPTEAGLERSATGYGASEDGGRRGGGCRPGDLPRAGAAGSSAEGATSAGQGPGEGLTAQVGEVAGPSPWWSRL